jgi:hypothetical protein
MKHHLLSLLICCLTLTAAAQFPEITQGDLTANDSRFAKPIDQSKQGELTIASFNIRNLAARSRSLQDFANLVDLVDEADIVLIQEAGLGVYQGSTVIDAQRKKVSALVSVLAINFGDNWTVLSAPAPTGVGNGTETSILAHRKQGPGYTISAAWNDYIDLGNQRDMAVYRITLSGSSSH